jgi:hypothetical protein
MTRGVKQLVPAGREGPGFAGPPVCKKRLEMTKKRRAVGGVFPRECGCDAGEFVSMTTITSQAEIL